MLVTILAATCLLISAGFAFGVPIMMFGPRVVFGRLFERPGGRIIVGSTASLMLAILLLPFAVDPLISASDIAQMSAENFSRLHWKV
ncbi:MAG: hypothetical protein AAF950_03450 [Pseudomonadota bacterium]